MGQVEQNAEGVNAAPGASGSLLTRRRFMGLTSLSAAGVVLYSGEMARHAIEIVQRTIHIANLPDSFHGLRIAQLSDVHYDNFSEPAFVRSAVDHINALAPDLVLFTGDYISVGPDQKKTSALHANNCAAILGQVICPERYAVLGNHDIYVNQPAVISSLVSHGIPVLWDSYHPLERDGQRIWLVGLQDAFTRSFPDLHAAAPPALAKEPIIVMVHEPDFADTLLASPLGAQTDLILSGHTHGGQIRVPFLGAVFQPDMGRKYVEGLFRFQSSGKSVQLYVNRGLGTVGLPMRFNCPPEITLITLSAEPVTA